MSAPKSKDIDNVESKRTPNDGSDHSGRMSVESFNNMSEHTTKQRKDTETLGRLYETTGLLPRCTIGGQGCSSDARASTVSNAQSAPDQKIASVHQLAENGSQRVSIDGNNYTAVANQFNKNGDVYVGLFDDKGRVALRGIGRKDQDGNFHYEQQRNRHGQKVSWVGDRFHDANPHSPISQFSNDTTHGESPKADRPSELHPAAGPDRKAEPPSSGTLKPAKELPARPGSPPPAGEVPWSKNPSLAWPPPPGVDKAETREVAPRAADAPPGPHQVDVVPLKFDMKTNGPDAVAIVPKDLDRSKPINWMVVYHGWNDNAQSAVDSYSLKSQAATTPQNTVIVSREYTPFPSKKGQQTLSDEFRATANLRATMDAITNKLGLTDPARAQDRYGVVAFSHGVYAAFPEMEANKEFANKLSSITLLGTGTLTDRSMNFVSNWLTKNQKELGSGKGFYAYYDGDGPSVNRQKQQWETALQNLPANISGKVDYTSHPDTKDISRYSFVVQNSQTIGHMNLPGTLIGPVTRAFAQGDGSQPPPVEPSPPAASDKPAQQPPPQAPPHEGDACKPLPGETPYQSGEASLYPQREQTAIPGVKNNPNKYTAAHREDLPLNSIICVTPLGKTEGVQVRINDHGPYASATLPEFKGQPRIIDLTPKSAAALGVKGLGYVDIYKDFESIPKPSKPPSPDKKSVPGKESTAISEPPETRANFMKGPLPDSSNIEKIHTNQGHEFSVNTQAAAAFQGFVEALENAGAPIKEIGGYNVRTIAGTGHWSQHAYGNAIDIDQIGRNEVSKAFRQWVKDNPTVIPAAAKQWHIINGGGWRSPDFGHFEWDGTPVDTK